MIRTALAKDPTRRFADICTFSEALTRAQDGASLEGLLPTTTTASSLSEAPSRSHF